MDRYLRYRTKTHSIDKTYKSLMVLQLPKWLQCKSGMVGTRWRHRVAGAVSNRLYSMKYIGLLWSDSTMTMTMPIDDVVRSVLGSARSPRSSGPRKPTTTARQSCVLSGNVRR